MQLANNPHLEECPDFSTEAYQAQRETLVGTGMAQDAAIAFLKATWVTTNNQAKERWDQLLQERHEADEAEARRAADALAAKQALEKAEREAMLAEEKKKNRAKFVPVAAGVGMPVIDPVYFTAAYMTKLRKGEFQELWLTTPQGMRYLNRALGTATTPQSWSLSTGENGQVTVVGADELKLSKVLIKDEELSWEDFLSSLILLIKAMRPSVRHFA
ncbi:hypothetical protein NMY22_g20192 [Coprinellus aureogranulatus]|nr:hypothetical protein NMY22_g20192 [Coprinellus aureogranulatus]